MTRPGTLLTAASLDDPEQRDVYLRQEEALHAAHEYIGGNRGALSERAIHGVVAKFLEVMNEPIAAPPSHARVEADRDRLARELFEEWSSAHRDTCGCTMQYLDDCSYQPPRALRDWLREHATHAGELIAVPTPAQGARWCDRCQEAHEPPVESRELGSRCGRITPSIAAEAA